MSATARSKPNSATSRRLIGAALGLALGVAAAPFFNSANAAQPVGDATAVFETMPVSANGTANDTAIWVNPQDPTKSLVLGANGVDGVGVYDLAGAKQDQSGLTAVTVTGIDVRDGFTLGGSPASIVTAVGEHTNKGLMHFYAIDPATGKLTNTSATAAGIEPEWGSGKIGSVCMYRSPISNNTYAFVMSANGEMAQVQLIDEAGKVKVQTVRGYRTTPSPAARWDINGVNQTTMGACVVDDEMKTLYVSEKETGIWKFGAEPTDPMTGTLIETTTTATPAGHLTDRTIGLALAKTGEGTGYLIASSPASDPADAAANSFMVYDRAGTNAFIRSFRVANGTFDQCEKTDGIDAAAGNFGGSFTTGLFVCMDNKNTNSGAPNGPQNYKLVALEQVADMALPTTTTTAPQETTTTTAPVQVVPTKSGYWMVGSDGRVYAFGDAKSHGDANLPAGASAVDLEPSPTGNGYWIIDDLGNVYARGDAQAQSAISRSILTTGEAITSLSATKTGKGYWIFTSVGRAIPFGDAVTYGDMTGTKLNAPVLDSIVTASGKGYYMVAADGGIFSFGDAAFHGSMGGKKLNKPVQSLVPDSDGKGYWLVASDGGIFAFDAPFKGSMGDKTLNKPVTGMVRYGDGYLMVGEDGGIFSFSNKPFTGSLGANPPAKPITSVAALDVPVAAQ